MILTFNSNNKDYKIFFSKHSRERMKQRKVSLLEIEKTLLELEIPKIKINKDLAIIDRRDNLVIIAKKKSNRKIDILTTFTKENPFIKDNTIKIIINNKKNLKSTLHFG